MIYKHLFGQVAVAIAMSLLIKPSLAATTTGEFELSDASGRVHTALLLDTAIHGQVNGLLANITVKQTFKNDSDDWLNGRYVFPLPEGAAVDSLKIKIGDREIDGVIKEKQEAKRSFEKAKRAGKKAGLLEQHRANLFSVAVANIGPYEELIAEITFIDQVTYSNELFSLRLPTTLTPRYVPNASTSLSKQQQQQLEQDLRSEANVKVNTGFGWATNNHRVGDASDITPPQTHRLIPQTSHRFSLDLSLRLGLDLQNISSPSHPIASTVNASEVLVTLANGHELMNSDLVLEWQPKLGSAPKAALFHQSSGADFYTMMMLTPPKTNSSVSLPRDVTFIVDSSGSMAGQPMRQAKQALLDGLKYLNAGDRFNIVDFDSSYRTLYSQSQAATFDHLQNARTMINELRADGGTEMIGALKFALKNTRDSAYLPQVIFITDGAIGNEAELFTLIDQDLGEARLFTVGIGSAPNSFFMSKAAKFGRGSYTFIGDVNQVNKKMAALFEKITKPILRDIKIDWPMAVEQYPERLPDLYAGEPLTVLVKSSAPIDAINVSGSMLNTPWSQTLSMRQSPTSSTALDTDNLDTVWARQKIASLMDMLHTGQQSQSQIKPQIIELGIAHQVLTKFTAFVAIEKIPSKPTLEKSKHSDVPNLMPKGSRMAIPQTATPAALLTILGVLMMLISLLIRMLTSRQSSTALNSSRVEFQADLKA
ncbi:MAG: Ca-activated chloride channel family protein [Arenicella sp.]|jgi:Ca-activated chloride channel family protein